MVIVGTELVHRVPEGTTALKEHINSLLEATQIQLCDF